MLKSNAKVVYYLMLLRQRQAIYYPFLLEPIFWNNLEFSDLADLSNRIKYPPNGKAFCKYLSKIIKRRKADKVKRKNIRKANPGIENKLNK